MRKSFLILLISNVVMLPALADIAVIVNPKNSAIWTDEVQKEIKAIFMGTKDKFSDGSQAKPVDQSESSEIRKSFYLRIAAKDETAMNVHWSNLIFTGKARPPKSLNDNESVLKYVSTNQSAIGYVDSDSVRANVKVIHTIK